ncbi:MAG: protein translocase subunit SecD [Candidatus Peribacter sp.]|jgi:protein-export membrane protein SecD|nr:protein translocase subunit SecD [Candidatus Peribacter sp.]MBT4393315.1 protein translocase subunit SecD [Candidatus Peribacter sp.]MBT4600941.1 protein translocase subunit SecD [Candidatus Peribacter sp.]MBT5148830.1 protein translocase subunit SecD [Candidatus Peribacter sp.]MBT5637914.1 protein translocase subunit SecD [Candidatus Peribacter sp.]
MKRNRALTWPTFTILIAVFAGLTALPQSAKQWAPGFIKNPSLHFGLDLAGGTQLDFRISEKEILEQITTLKTEIAQMEARGASSDKIIALQNQLLSVEQQNENVVEAIRTVLERRINALGVSEAVITPSYFGNEKHLLVECPGVVDTQECINTVGKTIQLEFKEEFTEPTDEYESEVRAHVKEVRAQLKDPEVSLEKIGEDLGSDIGVHYNFERRMFRDQLPEGLDGIWNKTPNNGIMQYDASIEVSSQDSAGQPTTTEVPGVFLVEVLRPRTQTGRLVNEASKAFEILETGDRNINHVTWDERTLADSVPQVVRNALGSMQPGELRAVNFEDSTSGILFLRKYIPGQTDMEASHILVSYKGASSAGDDVTRSKEEALTLANELKTKLDGGSRFETLARQYSDGPSGKDGGSLGAFGIGTMVPVFEQVAASQTRGSISTPTETQFGYHIIRTDRVPTLNKDTASYEVLAISGEDATDRSIELIGKLQRGEIESIEGMVFLRTVFFSLLPTGWKDTYLDGKHFRSATVTLDPTTNIPIVQIAFDDEGAKLFQELTKENIGKRLAIFVGGQLVSAPTVQAEISGGTAVITGSQNFDEANTLAQDLNTGAIPAPIYLAGQRTVEATLGAQALRTSIKAALIGMLILMAYMILMYRMLGLIADIALSAYAILFFAILKLPLFLFSSSYIVLTLAGMAGIILSIGMAVDANVLIFERMKEELRKGKMLKTATETGFTRAWPSIRDGNISTLITCTILFVIGTSIVRGFAITLGMGVLMSMFSAIVITRWLLRKVSTMPIAEKTKLFY